MVKATTQMKVEAYIIQIEMFQLVSFIGIKVIQIKLTLNIRKMTVKLSIN